jgi:hypothetical protein
MVARQAFDYSSNIILDCGQIFDAPNEVNTEKLERHEFIVPFKRGTETFQCSECGAEFWGELERRRHFEKRHVARNLTPAEEDAERERERRWMNQVAPLRIEQAPARL